MATILGLRLLQISSEDVEFVSVTASMASAENKFFCKWLKRLNQNSYSYKAGWQTIHMLCVKICSNTNWNRNMCPCQHQRRWTSCTWSRRKASDSDLVAANYKTANIYQTSINRIINYNLRLIDWDGFLRVKWPNQQCQSAEGTHKMKPNRTKHHNPS